MRKNPAKKLLPLLIAAAAPLAHASVDLIAIGSLTGTSDLSGLTGNLESGVAHNVLGGIGSGIAWAGGNTFLTLPDRGPNADVYNPLVDNTTSYISRFHTLTLNLTASSSGALPYTLTPMLTGTTLLSSATPLTYGTGALGTGTVAGQSYTLGSGVPAQNAIDGKNYFTGRSDGFAAGLSTNPNNARLDPEGIRVSNDGKSIFITDEYGPYIYKFDRATGERVATITVPANLASPNLSAIGDNEISGNTVGRVANKGMEGLAITPDGKTLIGVMQANLEQDGKKNLRIVTINTETGETHEYGYKLTTGSGVSEIVAINDHQFLIDERDGAGLAGDPSTNPVKQLFMIDIAGAQDISGVAALTNSNYTPVTKSAQPFLNITTALIAAGVDVANVPSKIEGVAIGEDIVIDGITKHTLYVTNDNDFLANVLNANGQLVANNNNIYVFSFTDADLNGAIFKQQEINPVPVPAAAWLFGSAAAGLLGLRRKRAQR